MTPTMRERALLIMPCGILYTFLIRSNIHPHIAMNLEFKNELVGGVRVIFSPSPGGLGQLVPFIQNANVLMRSTVKTKMLCEFSIYTHESRILFSKWRFKTIREICVKYSILIPFPSVITKIKLVVNRSVGHYLKK